MGKAHNNRKLVCMTAAGLFLSLLLPDGGALASQWRQVRWVDDGDTVVLSDGTRVRYIGINAPEIAHEDRPAERFGPEARAFNGKLVDQKRVRLELDRERQDQYGRLLAYVFLKNGTFVNAELVRTGHAYYLFRTPNIKYDQLLLRLQRDAMAKRVGLWKGFPDKRGYYAGNGRSKRFHQPNCLLGKMISPKNRIVFRTKYEAFWAGYAPCRRCNP